MEALLSKVKLVAKTNATLLINKVAFVFATNFTFDSNASMAGFCVIKMGFFSSPDLNIVFSSISSIIHLPKLKRSPITISNFNTKQPHLLFHKNMYFKNRDNLSKTVNHTHL
jgi:hypothetical protein